jgi:hypothetical protein
MMRQRLLRGALPPLGYLLIALLLFVPASLAPWAWMMEGTFYLGELNNAYLLKMGLVEQHRVVVSTDALGYPQQGVLVFIAWANLAMILLGDLLGSGLAGYNLSVPVMLAWAGWAGFLLAKRVGASPAAAWIAGLVFAFDPVVMGIVYNGQIGYSNHGWLALFMLALVSYLDRGGWPRLLGVAASLAWVLLCSPYYGVFGWLVMPLVPLWWLWRRRERWRVTLRRGAWAVGVGALAQIGPYLYLSMLNRLPEAEQLLPVPDCSAETLLAPDGTPAVSTATGLLSGMGSAGVLGMVLPVGGEPGHPVVHQDYLGLSVLALLVLGLVLYRRRALASSPDETMASPVPWALGAVVFVVLALGPNLVLIERFVELPGGRWIMMPFYALWRWAPFFGRICTPYRFLVVTLLCLVPLLGILLGPALQRLSVGRRAAAVVAASALILLDATLIQQLPWPLPWTRVQLSPIYERIAADPDPVALLELPYHEPRGGQFWYDDEVQHTPNQWNERLAFHQTVHGKRLGVRMTSLAPPVIYAESTLVRSLADQVAGRERRPGSTAVPGCGPVPVDAWLQRHRFRYLVLHEDMVPSQSLPCILERLEASLTLLERDGDAGISLWSLEAAEPVEAALSGPSAGSPPSGAR